MNTNHLNTLGPFLIAFFCPILLQTTTFAADIIVPANIDHAPWNKLLEKYVDPQGLVDYQGWNNNPEDRENLEYYLKQYSKKSTEAATGQKLAASLINAYNAFTIQWILQHYPDVESIRQLDDSWEGKRHMIGGHKVSLDNIEHDMLRPLIGWKVHALIVCAARSCPPLQNNAYTASKLDAQIEKAYTVWLARRDLNSYNPSKRRIEISKIFDWFEDDFEKAGGVKKIIATYAPKEQQIFLKQGKYKIKYKDYHWGLNDQSGRGKNYKHSFFKSLF